MNGQRPGGRSPQVAVGSAHEHALLPRTATELVALGLHPREAVFDAGFGPAPTAAAMATVAPDIALFVVGSKANAGSRRTLRRRGRYRVGCEGRISHLKREYGAGSARLKASAALASGKGGRSPRTAPCSTDQCGRASVQTPHHHHQTRLPCDRNGVRMNDRPTSAGGDARQLLI